MKPRVLTGNIRVHLCVPQSANTFSFACGTSVSCFCRAQESADPDLLVCLSVADNMSDRRWFWMFTPQNGWSQHWHSLWRSLELIRREASVEEPAVLPSDQHLCTPGYFKPAEKEEPLGGRWGRVHEALIRLKHVHSASCRVSRSYLFSAFALTFTYQSFLACA